MKSECHLNTKKDLDASTNALGLLWDLLEEAAPELLGRLATASFLAAASFLLRAASLS